MNNLFLPNYISKNAPEGTRFTVGVWLVICACLVVSVAVLGGITRLTHSGLSMVTWEPLSGFFPPLSQSAWLKEFLNYQQFPEYKLLNKGMSLDGFKSIFWLEYFHRLLARLLGLVFALPFLFLLFSRRLEKSFSLKLFSLLVLGGMQGVMGWLMVASGLVERPDVSHYRLTAHLGLAVLIFISMIWLSLRVIISYKPEGLSGGIITRKFYFESFLIIPFVYFLILSGGLVAGLDAGFAFNTFPKMDDEWIPNNIFTSNIFGSVVGVQFLHRWLGVFVAIYILYVWKKSFDNKIPKLPKLSFLFIIIFLFIQGFLGILTLVNVVPIHLAALHQFSALILMGIVVVNFYLVSICNSKDHRSSV